MTTANADPFAKFKATQREAWAVFAPAAIFNTIAAAKLVNSRRWLRDSACSTLGAVRGWSR